MKEAKIYNFITELRDYSFCPRLWYLDHKIGRRNIKYSTSDSEIGTIPEGADLISWDINRIVKEEALPELIKADESIAKNKIEGLKRGEEAEIDSKEILNIYDCFIPDSIQRVIVDPKPIVSNTVFKKLKLEHKRISELLNSEISKDKKIEELDNKYVKGGVPESYYKKEGLIGKPDKIEYKDDKRIPVIIKTGKKIDRVLKGNKRKSPKPTNKIRSWVEKKTPILKHKDLDRQDLIKLKTKAYKTELEGHMSILQEKDFESRLMYLGKEPTIIEYKPKSLEDILTKNEELKEIKKENKEIYSVPIMPKCKACKFPYRCNPRTSEALYRTDRTIVTKGPDGKYREGIIKTKGIEAYLHSWLKKFGKGRNLGKTIEELPDTVRWIKEEKILEKNSKLIGKFRNNRRYSNQWKLIRPFMCQKGLSEDKFLSSKNIGKLLDMSKTSVRNHLELYKKLDWVRNKKVRSKNNREVNYYRKKKKKEINSQSKEAIGALETEVKNKLSKHKIKPSIVEKFGDHFTKNRRKTLGIKYKKLLEAV